MVHVVVQSVLVAVVGPAVVPVLPAVGLGVELRALQDLVDVSFASESKVEQILVEHVILDVGRMGVDLEVALVTIQIEPLVAGRYSLGQLCGGVRIVPDQLVDGRILVVIKLQDVCVHLLVQGLTGILLVEDLLDLEIPVATVIDDVAVSIKA